MFYHSRWPIVVAHSYSMFEPYPPYPYVTQDSYAIWSTGKSNHLSRFPLLTYGFFRVGESNCGALRGESERKTARVSSSFWRCSIRPRENMAPLKHPRTGQTQYHKSRQISCRGLWSGDGEFRWRLCFHSCLCGGPHYSVVHCCQVITTPSIGGSKDLMFEFLTKNSTASPAVPISYMLLRLVVTGRTGPKGAWWWYIVACSAVSPAWFMFWIVYGFGDVCWRRWSYLGSSICDKLTIW